jgi:uncharacterized protein YqeY
MTLKERIQEDTKDAMRSKDQRKLGVLRLLLAAIKQREVDERITLDDDQIISVIEKMLKQRRDSIAQFQTAGRQDLVDQESFEIEILQAYLPEQLSPEEVDQHVQAAIQETGATSMKDMGKVMAILKPKLQGKADFAEVSKKIKNALEQ